MQRQDYFQACGLARGDDRSQCAGDQAHQGRVEQPRPWENEAQRQPENTESANEGIAQVKPRQQPEDRADASQQQGLSQDHQADLFLRGAQRPEHADFACSFDHADGQGIEHGNNRWDGQKDKQDIDPKKRGIYQPDYLLEIGLPRDHTNLGILLQDRFELSFYFDPVDSRSQVELDE